MIGTPKALQYPPGDQPQFVDGTLPRLTSEVVRIDFAAGESTVTIAAAATDGASDGLKYQIYKEGDTDFANLVDDVPRIFKQEATPFVVYVILSNVHYQPENSVKYVVAVFDS